MNKCVVSGFVAVAAGLLISESAVAAEGTLKWKGDPRGGEWVDAANWEIEGTSSYTVEELLSKKVIWNFDALQDGAVVSNNAAAVCIAGIRLMKENIGTVTLAGTKDFSLPNADIEINVASGNTLEWEQNHSNTWAGDSIDKKVVFNGNGSTYGTVHINPSSAFNSYKLDLQPCGNTTVIFGKRLYLPISYVTLWNSATLKFESDMTIANLQIGHKACTVDLNGHTIYIGSGEPLYNLGFGLKGKITGEGNIVWSGGQSRSFGDEATPTVVSGLDGRWTLYDGVLSFPASFSMPSTLGLAVNGCGLVYVNADMTLCDLRGDGATGQITMKDGTALTLTAPSGTNATYAARIAGRTDVTKAGEDYTLTLTGDNAYTGSTAVAAGTLKLRRPWLRKGLVRLWSFEDPDDIGRDCAQFGKSLWRQGNPLLVSTNGVFGGRAVYLPETKTELCYLRSDMSHPENGFPVVSNAVSVSLWLKPSSILGSPCYIYRHGNWGGDGRQFALWALESGKKLELVIDNWLTSDSPNSPVISTPDLMDGQWHHVVISYSANTLKMWYDGVLKTTKTGTHTLNVSSGTPINLGSNETAKGYAGAIDDVAIWDHELTAEEVAVEFAGLGRTPANPAEILPDPVCHWAFKSQETRFKDEMGNADLEANPKIGSSVAAAPGAIDGMTALASSSFVLRKENFPTNFPKGQQPFTVSVRLAPGGFNENHSMLRWGDDSAAATRFRLWNSGCPRRMRITTGNRGNEPFLWSNCASGTGVGRYYHIVITADPIGRVLRMYRDGVEEKIFYDFTCDIGEGDLYLNADPDDVSASQAYLDDVRIYDKALSPYEVQVLSRSLATGSMGPVLPPESPVTVAAGATLVADGENHAVKSIAGAGDVTITGGSTLLAGAWTGFSGSIGGYGRLLLAAGAPVPAAATVSADVSFADDTVTLTAANVESPLVRTSGRVFLPAKGTVRLTDATSEAAWQGVSFKLAECSGYVGPATTDGWTFDPAGPQVKGKFVFVDGELRLNMSGRGIAVIVR